MNQLSLTEVYGNLHKDIQNKLGLARSSFPHTTTTGDASEGVWIKLFNSYLPKRYVAAKAHVVDSNGIFSEQIDVVIYDRQYSPLVFCFQEHLIVPAESVYAVFEVKQSINSSHVSYAQEKVSSVRRLTRTSLPIPHAGGVYKPKPPIEIVGGILTLASDWKPAMGNSLRDSLATEYADERLDIGCIAEHGYFQCTSDKSGRFEFYETDKAATAFLFKLISCLQESGTVPMIDIGAYGRWLRE